MKTISDTSTPHIAIPMKAFYGCLLILIAILLVALPFIQPNLHEATAALAVLAGIIGQSGIGLLLSALTSNKLDRQDSQ